MNRMCIMIRPKPDDISAEMGLGAPGSVVLPAGFEPAHMAPEANALSPELRERGLGASSGRSGL